MVTAEHRHLAEQGAELVELRVDWLSRRPDLGRLLRDRPTPVVVTCRRKEDEGRWRGTEEHRLKLFREAIISGAEYVDLEGDIADSVPRYGETKRIISYHNFQETPKNLAAIAKELSEKDADIIKIVTLANEPTDNVRMLELARTSKTPMIGFCMGEMGIVSRILCGRFGAPFTYASFNKSRQMAPGQLSFAEVRNLYAFDHINEETLILGLLGDPVAHSHSPLLHNAAFRHKKINAVYLPFRVPVGMLGDTIREFKSLGVTGYSVTIPHKERAVRAAPDEIAAAIGAANTLYQNADKKWQAVNTDYTAAMDALQAVLDQRPEGDRMIGGRRALVLGAGGVGRAIAWGLQKAGAPLVVSNRDKKRGAALAEELGCKFIDWANRGSEEADLVVNCTSVGMHPNVDETPYEQHWLRDGAIAFDTVYTPENTLFLKNARARGCDVVSGLDMFVRQAAAQFELFTGEEAPVDYMRETLRRGISAARR